MSIVGRSYLDPGDKLSGRFDPWRPCTVLNQWGPGGGPRNVLVEYGDGSQAVIPFSRRLRRSTVDHRSTPGDETGTPVPVDPEPVGLPPATDDVPEATSGGASTPDVEAEGPAPVGPSAPQEQERIDEVCPTCGRPR